MAAELSGAQTCMSQNTLKQHWKWPVGFRTMLMKVIMTTFNKDMKSIINPKTDHNFLKIKAILSIMIGSGNVDLTED